MKVQDLFENEELGEIGYLKFEKILGRNHEVHIRGILYSSPAARKIIDIVESDDLHTILFTLEDNHPELRGFEVIGQDGQVIDSGELGAAEIAEIELSKMEDPEYDGYEHD